MAREAEAKAKKEEEARNKKAEAAAKLAEKEAAAKVPPGEMFTLGEYAGLYSKFDEEGRAWQMLPATSLFRTLVPWVKRCPLTWRARGPGRKPGASLYLRKHLSLTW